MSFHSSHSQYKMKVFVLRGFDRRASRRSKKMKLDAILFYQIRFNSRATHVPEYLERITISYDEYLQMKLDKENGWPQRTLNI